jgi:hypothetical protein
MRQVERIAICISSMEEHISFRAHEQAEKIPRGIEQKQMAQLAQIAGLLPYVHPLILETLLW